MLECDVRPDCHQIPDTSNWTVIAQVFVFEHSVTPINSIPITRVFRSQRDAVNYCYTHKEEIVCEAFQFD